MSSRAIFWFTIAISMLYNIIGWLYSLNLVDTYGPLLLQSVRGRVGMYAPIHLQEEGELSPTHVSKELLELQGFVLDEYVTENGCIIGHLFDGETV